MLLLEIIEDSHHRLAKQPNSANDDCACLFTLTSRDSM
jgi:hypothetical protein